MLGCQDFCGYYDWTFAHVRARFGEKAIAHLWEHAIGGESQQHYLQAARQDGLAGLLRVWTQTGHDEKCDWTFTLDEARNTLRWDMRECPSKGHLIQHDLNADEDYCDHCMGWIVPLLKKAGVDVVAHEHNHCGQCWAEMSLAESPSSTLELDLDIRKDARWGRGYVDRFEKGQKCSLPQFTAADPCDVLTRHFDRVEELVVLGRGPSASGVTTASASNVLVTDATYSTRDVFAGDPIAILVGDGPVHLADAARRYHQTELSKRPLLLHAYMPSMPLVDFASHRLPRPVPILPLLIRSKLYSHQPGTAYPTSGTFLVMLVAALGKRVRVAGIDLFDHSSGRVYAGDERPGQHAWPPRHSRACEIHHLRMAARVLGDRMKGPPAWFQLLE